MRDGLGNYIAIFLLLLFVCFLKQSYSVAQADLELTHAAQAGLRVTILLTFCSKYWGYRCEPPYLASFCFTHMHARMHAPLHHTHIHTHTLDDLIFGLLESR